MNYKIKELIKSLGIIPEDEHYEIAELIVKECIYTLQLKIVRNGNTPENLRSREHIHDLANKFNIDLSLNYYPKNDEN